jgi:hypothetical protein
MVIHDGPPAPTTDSEHSARPLRVKGISVGSTPYCTCVKSRVTRKGRSEGSTVSFSTSTTSKSPHEQLVDAKCPRSVGDNVPLHRGERCCLTPDGGGYLEWGRTANPAPYPPSRRALRPSLLVLLSGLGPEDWHGEEVSRFDCLGEQRLQRGPLGFGEPSQRWCVVDHADEELTTELLALGREAE